MVKIQRNPQNAVVRVVDEHGEGIEDCNRFLQSTHLRGLSPATTESYAYDLALAYRWMFSSGLDLKSLFAGSLIQYIAWQRQRGHRAKSINRRLHTLLQHYRFITGAELPGGVERRSGWRHRQLGDIGLPHIDPPPTRQLRVKEAITIVEPLTVEQIGALLRGLQRYRDLCIVHLMLLCGLRSQETLLLNEGDIDYSDRRVRVHGKGDKERLVPLPRVLVTLLQRYVALERPRNCSTPCLFVVLQGRRRGGSMTRVTLRRVFRTQRQVPELANANPHRLRHTFGADMARSGVRLPILQKMMGHAHAKTTLQYINLSMTDVAAEFHRAMQILDGRYAHGSKVEGV